MTNRSFSANSDSIKEKFLLEQCHLLNDWESIGYSLTSTPENDIKYLKQGVSFNSNTLVLGPGTGLGAAFSNNEVVLPTEIGNTTNWIPALLKNFNIINDGTFLILEDIISGTGISKLYQSLAGECISAEEVIKRFDKKERNAADVINGFISSLAQVLSDLALAYVPGNGIFLAGGLSRTLAPLINHESFEKEFLKNKSSIHKDLLKNIKIGVITREHTCLYGNLNYFNSINKNN
jgi:glucokinase